MNGKLFIGLFIFALLFGCLGPSPPGDVSAKAVKGGIEIDWQASQSADVAGYNIYKSTEKGTLGSKINPAIMADSKYTDTSVSDGDTYYYTVKAISTGGNEDSGSTQVWATADMSPPTDLSISINEDSRYTNSTNVDLTVSADGAKECRFSNDGTNWLGWMDYTGSYNWQLESGDGEKTVYMECRDEVGNVGGPVKSSVELDTALPVVTLSVPESGKTYSENLDIKFSVADAGSDTVDCKGFLDGAEFNVGVSQTGDEHTVRLHPNEGSHTVMIQCADNINTGKSSKIQFNIVKKLPATLHIESGAGYVDTTQVNLDCQSEGATLCRFSNNNQDWSGWRSFSSTQSWSLTSGDGNKTVYMECKDGSGTMSILASDSVVLDTSPPPFISVAINDGDQITNQRQVTLGLYAFAATECRFANEDLVWSSYEPYSKKKSWTLSSGNGLKTVHYQCNDRKGKSVGKVSSSITLNQIPPEPPTVKLLINGGDDRTGKRRVTLNINSLYANKCRLRNDGKDWGDWFTYSGDSIDWTLSPGHGRKSVYVECSNDYGSGHAHASIYVDEQKPGAPRNLDGSYSSKAVHLTWDRPSDHYSDINDYIVYRRVKGQGSFSQYHHISSTNYIDFNVKGGLVYEYYVVARDNAGNIGDKSGTVSVSVDASKPSVQITHPAAGGEVPSLFAIGFTVVDTQYDTVSCRHYIDGSSQDSWTDYSTGSPQTVHTGVSPPDKKEKHTLKVECKDGSGNRGDDQIGFWVIPSGGLLQDSS